VDLGGIDGLLHVTDMSWKRVNHPSQVVEVGQEVEVQIIKINPDTQRISLGMKQLSPIRGTASPPSTRSAPSSRAASPTSPTTARSWNWKPGVEGLVHVSEMSWTKKNVHPGKIVSTSQEVDVMVLDVDSEKRRISLGLKQTMNNPWESLRGRTPDRLEHRRRSQEHHRVRPVRGPGPATSTAWSTSTTSTGNARRRGHQEVQQGRRRQGAVLDVDVEKERISLGIKQLANDPFESIDLRKKGESSPHRDRVTTGGIEVSIGATAPDDGLHPQVRPVARPRRAASRAFRCGREGRRQVTGIDKARRKVSLSIKAMESRTRRKPSSSYGSSDSGASLGDILGAALSAAGLLPPESADDDKK
jgi:small subunit ribosomal protein S1